MTILTKRNSVDRELAPCFKKLWSRSRLSKNSAICHVKITPSNLNYHLNSQLLNRLRYILNNSIDTWPAYPLNSFTMGVCKFSAICLSSSLPHKAHKTILKFKQSNLNWFYSGIDIKQDMSTQFSIPIHIQQYPICTY